MKLEDQVVSLELAKKLKELGVKQDAYFSWNAINYYGSKELERITLRKTEDSSRYSYGDEGENIYFSAFTVAELGEMLPSYYCSHLDDDGKARCFGGKEKIKSATGKTEADARAKMLIYLLENKLVTV